MYAVDVAKRSATYRIPSDLLEAATVKAAECGETVTDAVIRGLEAYVRGKGAAGIPLVYPIDEPAVHTPVESLAGYVEVPEAPPCKHPAGSVDELGMCHECDSEIW